MKNYISGIITIVFLVCPSISFSSYLIELKNGSTFITNHYWKEKGQIKFYCRGGVVGIGKDLVKGIRESDLPYEEKEEETKIMETDKDKTDELDTAYYMDKKLGLINRLRNELIKLHSEKNKYGDDEQKITNRKTRIEKIEKKISDLAEELKSKNKGVLPSWWEDLKEPTPEEISFQFD